MVESHSARSRWIPYNCNSVIVNVRSLVQLLLQLGVTLARPKIEKVSDDDDLRVVVRL